MSRYRYIFLYLLSLVTVTFGVLMSFGHNWPDYVHTDYGFPFNWSTHIAVTIAGVVDIWTVNLVNLLLNIVV